MLIKNFTPWLDIPLAIALYIAALSGFLVWVHKSAQSSVPRTTATRNRLLFRLGLVFLLLTLVCYVLDFAFWLLVCIVLFFVIALCLESTLGLFGIPVLALAVFVREYVLGFPELVLRPANPEHDEHDELEHLDQLIGYCGTTTTPLRPQGDVEIDGKRYSAESATGELIDKDTKITVISVRRHLLLVTPKDGG